MVNNRPFPVTTLPSSEVDRAFGAGIDAGGAIAAGGLVNHGLVLCRCHHEPDVRVAVCAKLIDAGAQPGFVYIPLTGSLQVIPLGGYPSFLIQPWMPKRWFQAMPSNTG